MKSAGTTVPTEAFAVCRVASKTICNWVYKKRAEVATLLEDFVEPCPDSHYRLKNQFDRYFFASLPVFLRNHPMGPADALADALFFLGRQWARIDKGNLPFASIPKDADFALLSFREHLKRTITRVTATKTWV